MPDSTPLGVVWRPPRTVHVTVDAAERLLVLARSLPAEMYLPACAALVAASALGQHVDNKLHLAAALDANGQGYSPEETRPGRVLDQSFIFRVQELIRILSADSLELDSKSDTTRALRQIIDLRNELMHYKEPAIIRRLLGEEEAPDMDTEPTVMVTVQRVDKQGQAQGQPMQFTLRESQVGSHNPWDTLSFEEAGRLVASVKTYIATTEDADEPGTLTAGPFLRARQR